ncbi:MAG: FAD:protein FMN transferase [Planctomycetota bacterium]
MNGENFQVFQIDDQPVHRFGHPAMATTFEVVLFGESADYAEQAARAAFDELDRIEDELSSWRASSDISQINRLAPGEAVRVGADAMDCLQIAASVTAETSGAFDVSVGPLASLWANRPEDAAPPSDDEIAEALAGCGMDRIILDAEQMGVGLKPDATATGGGIDLGGIGKGYGLDEMARVLRDWDLTSALLSAGQSTLLAMGPGADHPPFALPLRDPADQQANVGLALLRNDAVSGSGTKLHGEHILDPRTGRPVRGRPGAWAMAESAAESDALSTALMVVNETELRDLHHRHPDLAGLTLRRDAHGASAIRFGEEIQYFGRQGWLIQ